ncbi:sugar ABC transporter permease [Ligilactobacillus agilis]|jgi:arabinogalactan oligomer / maltooligosaccharide transport system permease protein|uniref:sugar ABC transporter permease n=1 Tax=Ligilactobacillus agilis TaxID=1601 RepID=UPI00067EC1FF|nr:sugar ABC transporter permease [Ligilactobacillus agilis]MBM6762308.1 sugar ABC transporter permease [Ligilactobacillus agilis]
MKSKNPQKAMLLSLIPGLGQISNGQKAKGGIFLGIFALFIIEMLTFGASAVDGIVSLGHNPGVDNSMFLLVRGTLQLLILVLFVMFYVINMVDAKHVAQILNKGGQVGTSFADIKESLATHGFPYLLTFPAYILMIFTIILPVLVTLFMAFTNYDFNHIPPAALISWTGLENLKAIFTLSSYKATFGAVFGWTLIWTLCASTLQIVLGIFTAVVAHQDFIKGKKIFGIIFLLPWAVPAFVTILSFSNIFNDSAGAINVQVIPFLNHLFPFLHIPQISWMTDPFWTKVALIMIQGWLGFPYVYVLVTGILQSISDDLYEAATIDGASAWQKFRNITLPAIFAVAAPTFVTQYTFNFNNFSIIYLFNNGGPGDVGGGAGNTDILISWIYKLTTGTTPQYGLASAITIIISLIVIGISLAVFKKTKAFDMEG